MKLKERYEFFEKIVNAPKREKTLTAISNHPEANELARLVFERADESVFSTAKNQLLSTDDADEYGPFDHLLEPWHCQRMLKLMAKDDYVVNILKENFRLEHDRLPDRLSDIARIASDREEIKKESSLAKRRRVFKIKDFVSKIKIGSEWIVADKFVDGVDDEQEMNGRPYVYKILRSNEIQLKRLNLPTPSIRRFAYFFLFEPFLISVDLNLPHMSSINYYVFNLLEPSETPRTIKREGLIRLCDFGVMSVYNSDVRHNGELRESVLFPVIYKPDETSVCVECIRISSSSLDIFWKETIILPEEYSEKELFI